MSGPPGRLRVQRLTLDALDQVLALEQAAYDFPWTRGNFIDSLASGYPAEQARDDAGALAGYWVAMVGVGEMHLLNLTVAPACQGHGFGAWLFERVLARARAEGAASLWLEVRPSNTRALALYGRRGMREAGRRRGYYPAPGGTREDAIVMALDLSAGGPADAH